MRFDLGVDGPRRSEANLIRPSREGAQAGTPQEFKPWAVPRIRITSPSNAGVIHCFDMKYPQEEKRFWDAVVTRISLSRPLES
jgi:hypothetical protein